MTRIAISLLVLVFAVAGLAMTAQAQQDQESEPAPIEASQSQTEPPAPTESPVTACKPDTILVKVKPGVDAPTVISRHGGTLVRTISGIDVHVVSVPAGTGLQKIDELNADPEVKYAEADQVVRAVQAGGPSGGC